MRTLMDMLDTVAYDTDDKHRVIQQVGRRINEYRLKNATTTGELANLCGLSESCIFNTEKGRTNISVTNLLAICLALDITLDELIPPSLYTPGYREQKKNK